MAITADTLAPARRQILAGATFIKVKTLMDLSIMEWLGIQQDLTRYGEAMESDDFDTAAVFLLALLPQVTFSPSPDVGAETAIHALSAFVEGLQDESRPVDPEPQPEPDYGLLAARLAKEYGGGIWHWLNETPVPVFNAGLSYIRGLQAETALQGVSIGALGSGRVDPHKARQVTAAWEREANRLNHSVPVPETRQSFIRKLQSVGFKVEAA